MWWLWNCVSRPIFSLTGNAQHIKFVIGYFKYFMSHYLTFIPFKFLSCWSHCIQFEFMAPRKIESKNTSLKCFGLNDLLVYHTISQTWHFWHLGLEKSLWWGWPVHWTASAAPLPLHLGCQHRIPLRPSGQPRGSADTVQCVGGSIARGRESELSSIPEHLFLTHFPDSLLFTSCGGLSII